MIAIEYNNGFGFAYVGTQQERTAMQAEEKRLAIIECRRLDIPVQDEDPRTTHKLFGLCKQAVRALNEELSKEELTDSLLNNTRGRV